MLIAFLPSEEKNISQRIGTAVAFSLSGVLRHGLHHKFWFYDFIVRPITNWCL